MAVRKIKDLAVKVSSYTDESGQSRGRFVNVGGIFRGDDGNEYILMARTFNPAGVPNPNNKESVLIGIFDLRDDTGQRAPQRAAPQASPQSPAPAQSPRGSIPNDDDIPF